MPAVEAVYCYSHCISNIPGLAGPDRLEVRPSAPTTGTTWLCWRIPMFLAISLLALLLGAVVNVAFAFAVVRDADECRRKSELALVWPSIWFLATLLGGPFVAAIYWLLNHSTLNPRIKYSPAGSRPTSSTVEHLYEEGTLRYGNEANDAAVDKFLES